MVLCERSILEIFYSNKKADFPSNIISTLHSAILNLWACLFYLRCDVSKNKNIFCKNSLAIFRFWLKHNFWSDIILPKKSITTQMKSSRACLLHPHDDHFVDICFETVDLVLNILKRSNGFISLSNTNSNVYQILLELNCIDDLPGSF